MKYSEYIKAFLDFLRETRRDYDNAVEDVNDAENQTQDILHSLELEELSYHQSARLALALCDVRQLRREAKDRQDQLRPLMDWITVSDHELKALERTLGFVRKAEKSTEERYYCKKTDIVTRTLGTQLKKEDA